MTIGVFMKNSIFKVKIGLFLGLISFIPATFTMMQQENINMAQQGNKRAVNDVLDDQNSAKKPKTSNNANISAINSGFTPVNFNRPVMPTISNNQVQGPKLFWSDGNIVNEQIIISLKTEFLLQCFLKAKKVIEKCPNLQLLKKFLNNSQHDFNVLIPILQKEALKHESEIIKTNLNEIIKAQKEMLLLVKQRAMKIMKVQKKLLKEFTGISDETASNVVNISNIPILPPIDYSLYNNAYIDLDSVDDLNNSMVAPAEASVNNDVNTIQANRIEASVLPVAASPSAAVANNRILSPELDSLVQVATSNAIASAVIVSKLKQPLTSQAQAFIIENRNKGLSYENISKKWKKIHPDKIIPKDKVAIFCKENNIEILPRNEVIEDEIDSDNIQESSVNFDMLKAVADAEILQAPTSTNDRKSSRLSRMPKSNIAAAASSTESSSISICNSIVTDCGQETCELCKLSIDEIAAIPNGLVKGIKNKLLSCPDFPKHTLDGIPLAAYIFLNAWSGIWPTTLAELENKWGTEIFHFIDNQGQSTMHWLMTAVRGGPLTEKLLCTLDPNIKNNDGMTPLQDAFQFLNNNPYLYTARFKKIVSHIFILIAGNSKLEINHDEFKELINNLPSKRQENIINSINKALEERQKMLSGLNNLLSAVDSTRTDNDGDIIMEDAPPVTASSTTMSRSLSI